jgi:hypothetical protein
MCILKCLYFGLPSGHLFTVLTFLKVCVLSAKLSSTHISIPLCPTFYYFFIVFISSDLALVLVLDFCCKWNALCN